MLAYLEGFAGVKNAFIFYASTEQTIDNFEKIDYPRSGSLFRVGVPIDSLLDENWWKHIASKLKNMLQDNSFGIGDHSNSNASPMTQ